MPGGNVTSPVVLWQSSVGGTEGFQRLGQLKVLAGLTWHASKAREKSRINMTGGK